MAAPRTAMTPEREAVAREMFGRGGTLAAVSAALGLRASTVRRWAVRYGVAYADGRKGGAHGAAARVNIRKAVAVAAQGRALPLSADERARYDSYRLRCRRAGARVTRADAYRAIGRADLAEAQP